jgi:KaiC/GvpD/RAD55 family RecA-like ATPase
MADIDVALAAAIVHEGTSALRLVLEQGLSPELLHGPGKDAYTFVVDFYKKYGNLPTKEVVASKTGVTLTKGPDPLGYLVDSVFNRATHNALLKGIEGVAGFLENNDAVGGRLALESLLRDIRKLDTRTALVESLPALGEKVVDYYERIKNGERGIQTPWPTINESTLGFWPEDLVLFAARLGQGKTWVLIQMAGCAWEQGKKVLIATTEMAKERLAMRYFAYKYRLPYDLLRKGRLNSFEEKKLKDGVAQLMGSPNLNIVGGDFDFSMDTFAGIVQDERPDIVFVDGAYLMRVPGLTRTERAANVFDELKRIAKRTKCAVVATTQFNREVKQNQTKTVQSDSIALTDVAGWNADLIFGLIQTEDMRTNKVMAFKPLKVREGSGEDIECNWDFDSMDFSEIPRSNTNSPSAPVPSSGLQLAPVDPFDPDAGTNIDLF